MRGQTGRSILANRLQRTLRQKMTDAEQYLWRSLRRRQFNAFKFRRQHPFGDYVLDFVCLEQMLVIEVDGGQHAASARSDELRTKKLAAAGFRVLRFWNHEVLGDIEAVHQAIWMELTTPSPSQPPP
jgi:very-short-patch-repair endonuclease